MAAPTLFYKGTDNYDDRFVLPSGIVAGDLLLVVLSKDSGPDVTPPSGWTKLDSQFGTGDGQRAIIIYKIAAGTESSTQVFLTGDWCYLINVYRGVDTTTPFGAKSSVLTNLASGIITPTNVTIPAVTTTVADSIVFAVYTLDMTVEFAPYDWSTPTGFGNKNSYQEFYEAFCSFDMVQTSAGSSGTITSAINTAGVIGVAVVINAVSSGGTGYTIGLTSTSTTTTTLIKNDSKLYNASISNTPSIRRATSLLRSASSSMSSTVRKVANKVLSSSSSLLATIATLVVSGLKLISLTATTAMTGSFVRSLIKQYSVSSTLNGVYQKQSNKTLVTSGTSTTNSLRAVALQNHILTGSESRGRTGIMVRYPFTIGSADTQSLVITDVGWIRGTSNTADIANAFDIVDMVVENGTNYAAVTKGGSRTWTVSPGDNDSRCDTLAASALSLPYFARGTTYWIKFKISISSTSLVVPFGNGRTTAQASGSQVLWYNPAVTFPSTTDAVGTFTSTGTAADSRGNGYCPLILGTFVNNADPETWFAAGDSIFQGQGDNTNVTGGFGIFQRTLYNGGTNILAGINFSRIGSAASNFNSATGDRCAYWSQFCKNAVYQYGTNDFGTTGTSQTASAFLTTSRVTWGKFKGYGCQKVIATKLGPRTTSTDLFTTEGNQTITGSGWGTGSNVAQYNTLLDGEVGVNIDAVVQMVAWRGTTDPIKWYVTGANNYSTSDGTHPSPVMHTALSAEVRPVMEAVATPGTVPNMIASIRKTPNKLLSASSSLLATIATLVVSGLKLLSLTTSVVTSSSFIKDSRIVKSATGIVTSNIVKSANWTRTTSSILTGTIKKDMSRSYVAALSVLASIANIKAKLIALIASVTTTSTLSRQVSKSYNVSSIVVSSIVRSARKVISASVSSIATATKLTTRTFITSVSSVAQFIKGSAAKLLNLVATSNTITSITKAANITKSTSITVISSVRKNINKLTSTTTSVVTSIRKFANRSYTASISMVGTLIKFIRTSYIGSLTFSALAIIYNTGAGWLSGLKSYYVTAFGHGASNKPQEVIVEQDITANKAINTNVIVNKEPTKSITAGKNEDNL